MINSIIKICILFLFSFILIGCSSEIVQKEVISVKIIDIKEPKYFKLIVVVPGTDKNETIDISKRCQVKKNLIGTETMIVKTTYVSAKTGEYSYKYNKYLDKSAYCD